MSHPHSAHRQHHVERRRVDHITKGYAHGGAVRHADEKADMKLIKSSVKKSALKAHGEKPKHRMDKRARGGKVKRADGGKAGPSQGGFSDSDLQQAMNMGRSGFSDDDLKRAMSRARGGRTKKKGTTVNIINAPGHQQPGMAPPMMAPHPPMPAGPMPGAMPPGAPPAMPPAAAPPMAPRPPLPPQGMPMRASGGRVKSGPAWSEGLKNGTQVEHMDGKLDGPDIGRKKPITYKTGGGVSGRRLVSFYATGGKVEAPQGVAKATKLPGGSGGGEARLAKEKRAERDYKRA